MIRKLILLAASGLFCGATAAGGDDAEKTDDPKAGKFDKAKLFAKMDANGDGKVTKEEFKIFADAVKEKLKDKGAGKGEKLAGLLGADKLFEKMDANKDGEVSKEEFEKFDFAAALRGKIDPSKLKNLKNKSAGR